MRCIDNRPLHCSPFVINTLYKTNPKKTTTIMTIALAIINMLIFLAEKRLNWYQFLQSNRQQVECFSKRTTLGDKNKVAWYVAQTEEYIITVALRRIEYILDRITCEQHQQALLMMVVNTCKYMESYMKNRQIKMNESSRKRDKHLTDSTVNSLN